MLTGIETMFDQMGPMLKKVKKRQYEENMKSFRKEYGHYITEMTDYMKVENKQVMAMEIAKAFVTAVKDKFEKKGKIKGYVQMDLNFFMIYYVFPAILLTEDEDRVLLADTLCKVWGAAFQDSKIGYSDYDTIYNSFNEKIFGLF